MNPRIYILDHATGKETEREMTDVEIANFIIGTQYETETATEQIPASDDAGAPSTDAG